MKIIRMGSSFSYRAFLAVAACSCFSIFTSCGILDFTNTDGKTTTYHAKYHAVNDADSTMTITAKFDVGSGGSCDSHGGTSVKIEKKSTKDGSFSSKCTYAEPKISWDVAVSNAEKEINDHFEDGNNVEISCSDEVCKIAKPK
jgi:hypothetical protein